MALNLRDLIGLLRTRWITVCATAVISIAVASAVSLLTTPLYESSTRLFVSTVGGDSLSDMYQGTLFSQQRVLSYTQLIQGQTLATRTISKLGLKMKPEELESRVSASAKPGTVLIDFKVRDESPVRARDLANAMSDEFVAMVRDLETPPGGSGPDGRVVVEQRASLPDSPVVPNTVRNLALGVVVGLLLGLGLAVLRDYLDNTVKRRETLEEITGAGVVGIIPLDKEIMKEPAISFEKDHSAIAEAFRKIPDKLSVLGSRQSTTSDRGCQFAAERRKVDNRDKLSTSSG